jgi:LCP family protein required for cell wall assembly
MNKFRNFIFLSTLFSSLILFILGTTMLVMINTGTTNGESSLSKSLGLNSYGKLKDPFNILLLGGDVDKGLTDTLMVINYNPESKKISILSLPRDTRVNRYKRAGYSKINAVFNTNGKGEKGTEALVCTVQDLLQINIQHFVLLDTKIFRNVIDELGGVEFDVPCDMYYKDKSQGLNIDLKKGPQLLDGDKAEQLVRFRKTNRKTAEFREHYDGSDLKRINMQQEFLKELFKQKANLASFQKVNEISDIVMDKLQTDIRLEKVIQIGSAIKDADSKNLNTYKLGVYDVGNDVGYNGTLINTSTNDIIKSTEILPIYFVSEPGKWNSYTENNQEINTNQNVNQNKNVRTKAPQVNTPTPTRRIITTRPKTASPVPSFSLPSKIPSPSPVIKSIKPSPKPSSPVPSVVVSPSPQKSPEQPN